MALKVYVVEDSPLIVERLREMLGAIDGTEIAGHASEPGAAIGAILAARPDIVVLDIKLGDDSGFDVLRAVHDRAPAIDVYMLSNFATEPYRRLAERLGARGFFDKSTEFEHVRDVIAARARAHREVRP